jgi:uncharacterized protein
MILSKYNYIIDKQENTYWFNGVSRSYIIIEKNLSDKLISILDTDSDILREKSPKLYQQLAENNFIIEDGIDETDIIREKYRKAIDSKDYHIVIMPTLNCNYKCWYCIQDHIDTKMGEHTIEAVKKHIDYMISKHHITSLHIDWFGGEPFMFFEEVVEPISAYAKTRCEAADIPAILTTTTNAYYLTKDIHGIIDTLGFSLFQITLDGVRDIHNSVKFSDNVVSAFDLALQNIDDLLSTTKNPTITLRLNYTSDNLDEKIVEQINDIIRPENRRRINVYFRKVWQEETDKDRSVIIGSLLNKFSESGYHAESLDCFGGFIPCYTDRKYFNTINYNGHVLKCTANNDMYSDVPIGQLQSDGTITWKDGFLEKFHKPRFENGICVKCKELPICMGPCCNKDEEKFICHKSFLDRTIEEEIINFVEISERTIGTL